jgi:hypothetical protein
MIQKVEINIWITKTFLKNNCQAYLAQLDASVLEKAREALMKIREMKKVPEWRHYCGAEPRYWDIMINDDGTIIFDGGIKWHAEIKGDIFYTDGCTTRGLLIDVLDEGIRQARTLNCNRWVL